MGGFVSGRRLAALTLVAAAALLLPATASAMTASIDGTDLRAVAVPGDRNLLAIEVIGPNFHVVDDGTQVTPGSGCSSGGIGGHRAICPTAGIDRIVVVARDDDDEVRILAPVDAVVRGGPGVDALQGGTGDDLLFSDTGRSFGFGTEELIGGDGDDILRGPTNNAAVATMRGGEGDDKLLGGPGEGDSLDGGPGADVMSGGGGAFDFALYNGFNPITVRLDDVANDGEAGEGDNVRSDIEGVEGGSGNDKLVGTDRDDILRGRDGNDELLGLGGDDFLSGSNGLDTLVGGPGDDNLNPGFTGDGSDELNGGPGDEDIADYSSYFSSAVDVSLNNVADDGVPGENDFVRGSVEGAWGGSSNDTLTGNGQPNHLRGGAGQDLLSGGGGPDRLFGDFFFPSSSGANDVVNGGGGEDLLTGGAGGDTLNGNADDDLMRGDDGADTLDGGHGSADLADYSLVSAAVDVRLDGSANDGEPGENDSVTGTTEGILGGNGNDTLVGDAQQNVLFGGGGDDALHGLGGDDLLGGETPGLFQVFGSDVLFGNGGEDTVSYAGHFNTLDVSIDDVADDGNAAGGETDNVTTSVENLIGGFSNDILTGTAGANLLAGGPGFGNDTLNGLAGNDYLVGERGSDQHEGGGGADAISSRNDDQIDTDNCGAGSDRVFADSFDNVNADCENVVAPAAAISSDGPGSRRVAALATAYDKALRLLETVKRNVRRAEDAAEKSKASGDDRQRPAAGS